MSLKIIRAGIFDTIQDGGRHQYRHLGIGPNGPLDRFSAQLANALLGKEQEAPLLELHYPAPIIQFLEPTIICLTGADFTPMANGRTIPNHRPAYVPANSRLEFQKLQSGKCCYLALLHQLDAEQWLGSYSTHTKIGTGGYKGRPLQQNDCLEYKEDSLINLKHSNHVELLHWQATQTVDCNRQELHFLKGNEWHRLTGRGAEILTTEGFQVLPQSDRMGYRLKGTPLETNSSDQLLSSAVCSGTMQLLPTGQVVVLMADHQTTGGYPRIGHVTTADLPLLAQQQPGKWVRFKLQDLKAAEQELTAQHQYLHRLKTTCAFHMQNFIHAAL